MEFARENFCTAFEALSVQPTRLGVGVYRGGGIERLLQFYKNKYDFILQKSFYKLFSFSPADVVGPLYVFFGYFLYTKKVS